ncbi:MAG: hypothetical protein WCB11_09160 [Terriglobales bacterium]
MTADYGQLIRNLSCFYDFTGKVVLYVGAGGRQLLDPSVAIGKLIAIDRDVKSLKELKEKSKLQRMHNSIDIVGRDFEDVGSCGDVVYFEFCLHEMDDPDKALSHARTLAPDTVVFDHLPDSEWVFHAAEEEEVRRSAEAMEHFGVRRCERFCAEQRFQDHAELLAKVTVQRPIAIQRAERFIGIMNISIPMSYEIALL